MRLLLLAAVATLAAAAAAQTPTAYPNPFVSGTLTIEHGADAPTVEFYDLLGRRVDPRTPLAAGVYLWRLRLADGTTTPSQTLTTLAPGPIRVALAPTAALAAPHALSAAPPREDCRIAAPVFGGFQHEQRFGSSLTFDPARSTMTVTANNVLSSSLTCLGRVGGVSVGFADASSPYVTGLQFEVQMNTLLDDATTAVPIPLTLKTVGGTDTYLRLGTPSAKPRLVEVIDIGPDGTETVVASTVEPAGTPNTRRLARIWAAGGSNLELTEFTVRGSQVSGEALLDSIFSVRLGLGTDAPGGATVQIRGATVQGDAIVVSTPLDASIMFETLTIQTNGPSYQIDDLAFVIENGRASLSEAAPSGGAPAWLRPADANNLYSMDAGTTDVTVQCARGASCTTNGVRASSTAGASGAPTAGMVFRGLTAGPGRGFLFGTGTRADITMTYALDSGVDGEAVVSLSTPPASRSLVVDFQVIGGPPATSAEARYVRDGVVVGQVPLSQGEPVDLGLRVELTDVEVTTAPDGSILIRATDVVRPNSIIEIGMAFGPPVSDYLVITMENIARWSFSSVAAVETAVPAW